MPAPMPVPQDKRQVAICHANVMLYPDSSRIICGRTMVALLAKPGHLDRLAIGVSGLCLVHCLATAIFLGLVASVSGFLGQPIFHEVGLSLAMILGAIALGRGVIEHGFVLPIAIGALGLGVMAGALSIPHDGTEAVYTMIGVGLLALGHRLNFMAAD